MPDRVNRSFRIRKRKIFGMMDATPDGVGNFTNSTSPGRPDARL
jgi:hypothetical protein